MILEQVGRRTLNFELLDYSNNQYEQRFFNWGQSLVSYCSMLAELDILKLMTSSLVDRA